MLPNSLPNHSNPIAADSTEDCDIPAGAGRIVADEVFAEDGRPLKDDRDFSEPSELFLYDCTSSAIELGLPEIDPEFANRKIRRWFFEPVNFERTEW
jgi:hypothetical protein